MSDGVIGLLGVIAGGVLTGSVQVVIAWLHRRNESRTSARLLYGDILEARDILLAYLRGGEWTSKRDLAHVLAAWREHRASIARSVGVREFHDVAGAFKAIEFVQLVRDRNDARPEVGFALAKDQMPDAISRCDDARLVLAKAGCTRWERMRHRPRIIEQTADSELPTDTE